MDDPALLAVYLAEEMGRLDEIARLRLAVTILEAHERELVALVESQVRVFVD